ncbi:MAG: PTS system mannose-specific IIA component [Gammaproteobacteria bacterium]|jgi:PTS system ascorbate-specific IIA component
MTVSLLVITHNQLGQELIDTAASILGKHLLDVNFISISANLKPSELGRYADQVKNMIHQLDIANGILILTDICGATPHNLAKYFAADQNINIVSGISLPMLLRVLNYPNQSLQSLSLIALEGAHKGVIQD